METLEQHLNTLEGKKGSRSVPIKGFVNKRFTYRIGLYFLAMAKSPSEKNMGRVGTGPMTFKGIGGSKCGFGLEKILQ